MGTINPATVSDGETIDASDLNNPINTIANEINGNLDSDNLASNAVTTAKIQDSAVTPAKLLSGTGSTWTWQSWTPTLSGRFTNGDWDVSNCKYTQIGKTVFFFFQATATDATPMGGGAGQARFSIPVTSVDYGLSGVCTIAPAYFDDANAGDINGICRWYDTSTLEVASYAVSGSYLGLVTMNSTTPFTWTTDDQIIVFGFYEAA